MRRPRRELPPEGVYHVTTRGVARTAVFLDDDERRLFLALLAAQVRRHDWRVHAFCLLTNHYHLVVETQLWRLSDGMQRLNGAYAQAFNRRHHRSGHLFGDRFAAWLVESDDHLRAAVEYVLQNPVRAGLALTAGEWRWSAAMTAKQNTCSRPPARLNWLGYGPGRARRPRRPRAQPQGHHRPAAAERADLHHRALRLRASRASPSTRSTPRASAATSSRSRAYARQFLQMMEKPDVDSIDGLSPAISIDQKTTSRNPRSTVGTVTEIYDYLRLLYARVGRPHCPVCGRPIAGQSDRADRRPGAAAAGGDEVHGQRAGRPRPQGRVQGRASRSSAREGFTRVKVDGEQRLLEEEIDARQEVQAHDRGRRRPARDEAGPAPRGSRSRSRRRAQLADGLVGDRRRRRRGA